ncbi:uncharacterized protein [Argopecten irradians]|uniref:uncharacterized protein isoform X1 n=1 Tax=Argopecten irradians TaxID=31199 RepID=UPI0037114125
MALHLGLQTHCMFAFSIISISTPFAAVSAKHMSSNEVESINKIEQIQQLLEKLGSINDDPWQASQEHRTVAAKPLVPKSSWSVKSHGIVDISYNRNDDDVTQSVMTSRSKLLSARNATIKHTVILPVKPVIDVNDSTLWLGAGLGTLASLSILLLSLVVWKLTRRFYRRKRCIDLTELSLCSAKEKPYRGPVYVRLSQLHNPRKLRKDSHYVVSVLDESNNFSIDSGSESSSSEEELFNASGYKSSDNSFIQSYSGARVNLTSTPIKGSSPTTVFREQPTTPRPHSTSKKPLPISPLARRLPYNTPPSVRSSPKYTP